MQTCNMRLDSCYLNVHQNEKYECTLNLILHLHYIYVLCLQNTYIIIAYVIIKLPGIYFCVVV